MIKNKKILDYFNFYYKDELHFSFLEVIREREINLIRNILSDYVDFQKIYIYFLKLNNSPPKYSTFFT